MDHLTDASQPDCKEFDIETIINHMKEKRRVFVSEADFQLEFAWAIKELYPDVSIRLEYCPSFDRKMHIDILAFFNDGWLPIELKYKTKGCTIQDGNETFVLANHAAKDVNCYLYLKDIQRIESIKKRVPAFSEGYTVMLTNEPSYLKQPVKKDCVYAEFSLHEGAVKGGEMHWSEAASAGTIRGNESPIMLEGEYKIHWVPYSKVNESPSGTFYYLYNRVAKED